MNITDRTAVSIMAPDEFRISTGDGKYRVIRHPDGSGAALRHGAPWRDLEAGCLELRIAADIHVAQLRLAVLVGNPYLLWDTPDHDGPDEDLLRLSLSDGTELVQDKAGAFSAIDADTGLASCEAGNKFALALAYDLEGYRSSLLRIGSGASMEKDHDPEGLAP